MKKLRILFLAVLAMALMASGAFAANPDAGKGLKDLTALTLAATGIAGTGTEADPYTLTLAKGAAAVDVTMTARGTYDASTAVTFTVTDDGGTSATKTGPTDISVVENETTGTSTLTIAPAADKTGVTTFTIAAGSVKAILEVTVVDESTKTTEVTLSCDDDSASFTPATTGTSATNAKITIPVGVEAKVKATLSGSEGYAAASVTSGTAVTLAESQVAATNKVAEFTLTAGTTEGTAQVTFTPLSATTNNSKAVLEVTVVKLPAASGITAVAGKEVNGAVDINVTLTVTDTTTINSLPVKVTNIDSNVLLAKTDGTALVESATAPATDTFTVTKSGDGTYTGSFKALWKGSNASAGTETITLVYNTSTTGTAKLPKDMVASSVVASNLTAKAKNSSTADADDANNSLLTILESDFNNGVANVTLTLTTNETDATTLPLTLASLPKTINVSADVDGKEIKEGGSFDVTASGSDKKTFTAVLTLTANAKTVKGDVKVAYIGLASSALSVKTVTMTVPAGIAAATKEDTSTGTTASADIKAIAFTPTSASVKVGATTTVKATITISGDKNSTKPTVSVNTADKAIATAKVSGDVVSADGGKTFTVSVVVTGVKSSDSTVKVGLTAVLGKNSKTESFDVTVTAASDETGGDETTTVTSPDIDWYEAYSFNNKTWTLKYSADEAGVTQTAAVVVSSDFTATPKLVISPDANDYVEFTVGTATKASSSDKRGTVYTFAVTATPLSVDAKGSSFTTYATVTSGSVYKTDSLTFTVIVSDDTKSSDSGDDSGSDTVVTSWDLTVEADKTEATLNFYEKTTVVITSKPADDGVDFVITNNASSTADYKLESKDEFSSTAYVVTYTFTAGETEGEYPITFTVKATSGDDTPQTETVTVTFTVAYDETKQVAPEAPADLAETLGGTDQTVGGHTFHIDTVAERADKFKAGKGVVGWGVKAPFKVRKVFGEKGWWFRFLNAVLNEYFKLNAPQTFGGDATASIADDVASRDAALTVGFQDDNTAFFELDLEKAAATLPEGATYQANSSYTSDATADDGGKPSDPMTAGELKGTKSSTTPGKDEPGKDEPGEEEGDAVNFLGGSSGGCDAGFGALALALAASMIFVRKRS